MTRTYDYPYFNLRLTWGEVEAEEYRVRVLKGRAACSRGGPGCCRRGRCGFSSTREWPQLPAHPGTRKGPRIVRLTS